jgi:hypothetical protein
LDEIGFFPRVVGPSGNEIPDGNAIIEGGGGCFSVFVGCDVLGCDAVQRCELGITPKGGAGYADIRDGVTAEGHSGGQA